MAYKYEIGRTFIVEYGIDRPKASYFHDDVEKITNIWKNLDMSCYMIQIQVTSNKRHTVHNVDIESFLAKLKRTGSSLLAYK